MKTVAAVLTQQNHPLELMELAIPSVGPYQVIVEIHYASICRTQLNEITGAKGDDPYLPHTLGHEGSGVVTQVGHSVKHVSPGDEVVISWLKNGETGSQGIQYIDIHTGTPVNSGPVSTFMSHALLSQDRVTKLPEEIPLDIAPLFGCALPTGMGMVLNQTALTPEKTIAIFGLGGVGISALLAARLQEAEKIIAIDICEDRLDLALELGATDVINASIFNPVELIHSITEGKMVDYAIESAGIRTTMEHAFRAVNDTRGKCIIAGNLAHNKTISINPFDLIKGKQIVGSWGGNASVQQLLTLYTEAPHLLHTLRALYCEPVTLHNINDVLFSQEQHQRGIRTLIQCKADRHLTYRQKKVLTV